MIGKDKNNELKGNVKHILVKNDDVELKKASKMFIDILESEFIEYKKNYDSNFASDNGYSKDKNFYYVPEKLSKKSPLTIINAPWGTGKTYFIENLAKLFIKKEINSKIFKKMIIIDAWKFSNSKDVPLEFIFELSEILLHINKGNLSKENKPAFFGKMFKSLAPTSLSFQINLPFFSINATKDIDEKKKEDDATKKIIKSIKENEEPILIFIDNLERLGSLSWDLLKSVIRLQEFSNYLVILPLNISKIKSNKKSENNAEYPIDKYVDITMFNFKQDYFGYFLEKTNDKKLSELLNSIFSEEIQGKKMSIRDVSKSMSTNKLFDIDSTYKKIKIIYSNIWPATETIKNILISDLKKMLDIIKCKRNIIIDVYNNLVLKDNYGNYINFIEDFEEFDNNIINFKSRNRYEYSINTNYVNSLEAINDMINNYSNILDQKIQNLSSRNTELDNEIKKENNAVSTQTNSIEKYKAEIEAENSKPTAEKKAEIITGLNSSINTANSWISTSNINIKNSENEKNKNLIKISELNDKKNNLFIEIPEKINEYKKCDKELVSILGKEKKLDLTNYLLKLNSVDELLEENNSNAVIGLRETILEIL